MNTVSRASALPYLNGLRDLTLLRAAIVIIRSVGSSSRPQL